MFSRGSVAACLRTALVSGVLLLPAAEASADLVVVVNAQSSVEKLSRDEVVNIFLGRFRKLSSGVEALPIDVADAGQAKFYRLIVGKEMAEINAYWARLVFSGRTSPPRLAHNVDEALDLLAANPGAIAYLDRARVDRRVKIVLELGN